MFHKKENTQPKTLEDLKSELIYYRERTRAHELNCMNEGINNPLAGNMELYDYTARLEEQIKNIENLQANKVRPR